MNEIIEICFKSLIFDTEANVVVKPFTELQGMKSGGLNQGLNSSSSFKQGTTESDSLFNQGMAPLTPHLRTTAGLKTSSP